MEKAARWRQKPANFLTLEATFLYDSYVRKKLWKILRTQLIRHSQMKQDNFGVQILRWVARKTTEKWL